MTTLTLAVDKAKNPIVDLQDCSEVCGYNAQFESWVNMLNQMQSNEAKHDQVYANPVLASFLIRLQNNLFGLADSLSVDYKGGHWQFANGFFQLSADKTYAVNIDSNGWTGSLNGRDFSLVCALMTYSMLTFHVKSQIQLEFITYLYHRTHCLLGDNDAAFDLASVYSAID